jgi:alkanesulfonate monooxygenase SsuD/methylene tetrahydromethanopterin reductase-like flavin-dependent oxidoreductase (luciferase family)
MTINRTPELFARNLADIRHYAIEIDRDLDDDFTACLYLNINVNNDREVAFRESKRYLDHYYQLDFSRATVEVLVAFGSAQTCIERLQEFMQAGVTTFILRLIGDDTQQQFEQVTHKVLTAFK